MKTQTPTKLADLGSHLRLRVNVRGAVQGVGFRPFIYRLAGESGLAGWVCNSAAGVEIEVEGLPDKVNAFCKRLASEHPPPSVIQEMATQQVLTEGSLIFEIRPSDPTGEPRALILPDLATCGECLNEIFDPSNRRYGYPFTNCTRCGPRFSIIEALPYDRKNTSMRHFEMCAQCSTEYHDPSDRRFHAQPNACTACGPSVQLWDGSGTVLNEGYDALLESAAAICQGAIVAVKGLGGFHLFADARSEQAVGRLRQKKVRESKPLAVMFPSLAAVEKACALSPLEARLLQSPEAPIVLLRKRKDLSGIAEGVAPANPWLGALLPYTPLHHLVLTHLGFAVVATSGNLSQEPICTHRREALERLGGIADRFLVHNRPILRPMDDSVVRVIAGHAMMLRRARGYAPLPITVSTALRPALALGTHLKTSVALSVGSDIFLSQHIGDLDSPAAVEVLRRASADLQRLYRVRAVQVLVDQHPDAMTHQVAHELRAPVTKIQHHYAHILSCMAENQLSPPLLGVAWDGTGYGSDGTIWGSEFLKISDGGFERVAHLRTFPLPGGEQAVREPRRSALGVLHELFGATALERSQLAPLVTFTSAQLRLLQQMLKQRVNCPRTSSMGRFFDAIASLLGLRQRTSFEGQAAMALEFAREASATESRYHIPLRADGVLDWEPALHAILADLGAKLGVAEIAAKFHNTLAEVIAATAIQVGEPCVVLSGGCFQNQYLTERAIRRLREEGFRPYWHQRVPPNDGGIALGQIAAMAAQVSGPPSRHENPSS